MHGNFFEFQLIYQDILYSKIKNSVHALTFSLKKIVR